MPAGITAVVRSSTELAFVAPRVFKGDNAEDTKAVQAVLGQIMVYPLSRFDGTMKSTDWSQSPRFPAPAGGGETKWVVPAKFFDRLSGVMPIVPPLPGEEALYTWIKSVLGRRQGSGAKQALIASFVAADTEIVGPLFRWSHNGRSAGNGWYSTVNDAQWGTDYINRAGTARSNMYHTRPNETKYFYRDLDGRGHNSTAEPLHGHLRGGRTRRLKGSGR